MIDPKVQKLLISVFLRLRQIGFNLGVGELLAVMQAVDNDKGTNNRINLKEIVQLLWCNSLEEINELETIWAMAVSALLDSSMVKENVFPPYPATLHDSEFVGAEETTLPTSETEIPVASVAQKEREWKPVPVQAPFSPLPLKSVVDLNSYWPVSRRFMSYIWRYLRRPIHDGPIDVLDVDATVEKTARQGFFLAPVYRRRIRNYAHLILLIDQGGSMMPFHHFSRDLVETAQYESNLGHVDVFYFHNVINENVYFDSHLTLPILFADMLEQCANDTSVLIVSDAGAARGHRKLGRLSNSTAFLHQLRQHTNLIAWLNPMPEERWRDTSAQIITHLVPMFQMDSDGMSKAIEMLRR